MIEVKFAHLALDAFETGPIFSPDAFDRVQFGPDSFPNTTQPLHNGLEDLIILGEAITPSSLKGNKKCLPKVSSPLLLVVGEVFNQC